MKTLLGYNDFINENNFQTTPEIVRPEEVMNQIINLPIEVRKELIKELEDLNKLIC
jgi:hypothetical protein